MRGHRHAQGFSLIELLVGTAVGLIVVAAAASVVAAHQREARRAETEARLTSDLRSAAELVGRDLRRAGHWAAAASGIRRADGDIVAVNPHASISPADGAASDVVALSFSTGAGAPLVLADAERFGFRLRGGAVEVQLGARNWQALSDPATLVVTSFSVAPRVDEVELGGFCGRACAPASATCPPRQQVRSFTLALIGRSAIDPAVTRSLQTVVRTRNDVVVGACEA